LGGTGRWSNAIGEEDDPVIAGVRVDIDHGIEIRAAAPRDRDLPARPFQMAAATRLPGGRDLPASRRFSARS
jgi:hypothetical protein